MSIPTPPDLARGKVSWTVGRTDGTTLPGARGTVRFEATAVAVAYSTATVLPAPVETPVVAGVMTPVDLLVNDPEVWNWKVTPRLGVEWEPFHIDVTGPVNLAAVVVVPGKGLIRVVRGERGVSVSGAKDVGGGRVRFELEDGTFTDPVPMPPGPAGPPNSLAIGTVTGGETAAASIKGAAPSQSLSLVLPKGDKPVLTWKGTALAVDGVTGPDLKGETGDVSTVPGPTGKTAYQYALEQGFEGTEEEFAQAQLPEQMAWGNLSDKPSAFPPSAHSHAASDVSSGVFAAARIPALPVSSITGLQSALDGKADSSHSHTWTQVTGKPSTFAPIIGTTSTTAAAGNHAHAWGAITGKPTAFPPAAHNHDGDYAAKSGDWVVIADPDDAGVLVEPWTAFGAPGGHYFQGLRYRITESGVIVQGMLSTPGSVGSTIAVLPDGHGIEFTSINAVEASNGAASVRVAMSGSYGAKTATLLYHRGPASASWLNINMVLPRG